MIKMFCSYNGTCFCTSATFCSLPVVCPSLAFLRARGRESHRPGELYMCGVFWIWIGSAGVLIQEALDDWMPNLKASFLVDWHAANIVWQLRVVMRCQFISTKLISKKTITSILSLSSEVLEMGFWLSQVFSMDLLSAQESSCLFSPSNGVHSSNPMSDKSLGVLVFWALFIYLLLSGSSLCYVFTK